MDLQDMTDLIYARDAYREMNKSLHCEEMALGFHEGYLGALGRIFRVIERNMSEKWRQDDNSAIRILDAFLYSSRKQSSILESIPRSFAVQSVNNKNRVFLFTFKIALFLLFYQF